MADERLVTALRLLLSERSYLEADEAVREALALPKDKQRQLYCSCGNELQGEADDDIIWDPRINMFSIHTTHVRRFWCNAGCDEAPADFDSDGHVFRIYQFSDDESYFNIYDNRGSLNDTFPRPFNITHRMRGYGIKEPKSVEEAIKLVVDYLQGKLEIKP